MRRLRKTAGLAGVLLLLLAGGAYSNANAQGAVEGRKLAEQHCSGCHSLGETGLSPHPAAPPFRSVAAKGHIDDLQEALAEGIMVGHPDMPQFEFQPEQIGDFLAYLKGLAPGTR